MPENALGLDLAFVEGSLRFNCEAGVHFFEVNGLREQMRKQFRRGSLIVGPRADKKSDGILCVLRVEYVESLVPVLPVLLDNEQPNARTDGRCISREVAADRVVELLTNVRFELPHAFSNYL
jgi:hypothetical protein